MNKNEVYMENIKRNGITRQIDMCIEECSELIQALSKFKRNKTHNVEEEIADVEITIEQLRMLFTESYIDDIKEYKIKRLKEGL